MHSLPAKPLESLRFLVADDDELQLLMIEQFLRGFGVETIHLAEDGARALAVLRDPSTPVDLAIIDVMMPGVDGIEFMSRLSGDARNVTMIIASASAVSLDAAEMIGVASGLRIVGTIHKPVTPENLEAVLKSL